MARKEGPRQLKLNPFKVLCLILYGSYDFIVWEEDYAEISIGPFARLLQVKNDRLKEYLQWLHSFEYLNEVHFVRGTAFIRLRIPERLIDEQAAIN